MERIERGGKFELIEYVISRHCITIATNAITRSSDEAEWWRAETKEIAINMNVWLGSPSSTAYFFQSRRIGSRNVIAIFRGYRKEDIEPPLRNRIRVLGQVSTDVIDV